ncbi:MAG: prenyltransferase [Proteobacteria bacterium]|nr:prenyltransferase [Pseudomonadota bacterium]NOG60746.1 prenyltransferase [Pseudomonadota bacterium]
MDSSQSRLVAIVRSSRPSFLLLTPVCVFLGWSITVHNQIETNNYLLALSLTGALLAHISVNLLNEYSDFKSGLDLKTIKTRFSGGSGSLPDNPQAAKTILIAGITALIITTTIGLFFLQKYGWQIIPIGVSGLLLIVTYTKWINRSPFLCLIAPGTGFGFFIVAGTYFVLTGKYTTSLWIVCLIPFFLVNNLLLLNQYPDIEADKKAGRKHLLITCGTKVGNIFYALFVVLSIVTLIASVIAGILPVPGLIALLPMPLAFYALTGAVRYRGEVGSREHYLAANVAVTLLSPTLIGISLLICA